MNLNARDAALKALVACRRNGAWSDSALKELLKGLDRRDAALASRLCYGVLQNRALLDFWIDAFAKGKLQPVVREILRLAVYQLNFLDKVPSSAAVNEAVDQAKRFANPAAGRLANGVLRNMLRTGLPQPEDLATRYSHPQALVDLLTEEFGEETTRRLLESHNQAPATVLQLNTLLTNRDELLSRLRSEGASAEVHPWLPDCITVSATGDLEQLPSYREGLFYVQDAAARLAVQAAGLQPGMKVLDCCAAPGGKSFAAAMEMKNRGEVISCDIHPHKIALLEKGAERLHISILTARLQDASKPVEAWKNAMDVVLADVPCSGLGVIRKKPEIRDKDLAQTERLPAVQRAILDTQAQYVKPGGVLLYSTCTILRRENETVAEGFLQNHPEFALETVEFPTGSGISAGPMTTLLPCDHGTDGFFICKFRRKP